MEGQAKDELSKMSTEQILEKHIYSARPMKYGTLYLKQEIKKMAKVMQDDLEDENTVDDTDEIEGAAEENAEPVIATKGRGRPKGSGGVKSTTAFHGVVLTKRGVPKRVIVTHVMGKNVRVVSQSNPQMEPVRILINSVRHFEEDIFEQLQERGTKIEGAIDQNFGLFNQLKPLNAPKRIAANTDPLDDL